MAKKPNKVSARTERKLADKEEVPKPTFRQRFDALQNLPDFFRQIYQTQPWMTIGNIILRLLRSAIPVLMLYIGKLIIDEINNPLIYKDGNADWSLWKDFFSNFSLTASSGTGRIWALILLEFALAIIADLLNRGIMLLDSLLGDLFANQSSVKIMEHASTLDLAQFEDPTFYDKLERARQQTVGRTALLSQTLSQVQDIISMVFLAAGLVIFNPWLILLLAASVVPSFLGELYFNAESYSLVFGWTPQRRELDYYRYIGASDATAKEVKMLGISDFLTNRYKKLSAEYYEANKKLSVKRAFWGSLLSNIGTAGYYVAYGIIIFQTIAGALTLGSLTFLAGSFRQLRTLLETILGRFTGITQGALYLKDYFDFFAIQPHITSPPKPKPFPTTIQTGFTFENVGFKYPNSERWANRNLNFTLRAGEKLALVGENGAGKTTLVKLLARLYDPDEGRILLDGIDIKEYDLGEFRKNIGVIFQDFIHLLLTARVNIAVGDIDKLDNMNQIEKAAHQSLADSVIQKLPNGYEQILGKHFKGGVNLSGGEWQKIALARAYMREAQLLILDEPTAALDARAEYEVFLRFAELTQGKSAVLISHRFSTVRMADRILVLEDGSVKEIGSHEELMSQKGRYAELFQLQAKGYQ